MFFSKYSDSVYWGVLSHGFRHNIHCLNNQSAPPSKTSIFPKDFLFVDFFSLNLFSRRNQIHLIEALLN